MSFINKILALISIIFITYNFSTSENPNFKKIIIQGTVIEKTSNAKIEYASVSIFQKIDSVLINGTITNSEGFFSLEIPSSGEYYLKITFIGFENTYIDNIVVQPDEFSKNLGNIYLESSAETIDEVVIEADRLSFDYNIDKKVINVDNAFTSSFGSVIDILENAPSVKIDLEGNVSMRGSSNFTVLINGVPSVLSSNEALEQIPASLVKQVEIITNPSAKYNPEGTAGIINIITKKNKLQGVNGMFDLSAGTFNNYGGNLLLNYNASKFGVYVKGDFNNRVNISEIQEESEINKNDTIFNLLSSGETNQIRKTSSGSIGFEWTPDTMNTFNIEFKVGQREMKRPAELAFEEWNSIETNHLLSKSTEDNSMVSNFYSVNLNYKHNFKKEGSNIIFQMTGKIRSGEEYSISDSYDTENIRISGKKATETGPETGSTYRMDYILPINDIDKIEAGFEGSFELSQDIYKMYFIDLNTSDYILQSLFSHDVSYDKRVNGAYTLYSGSLKSVEYQFGIRAEHTFNVIKLIDSPSDNAKINRLDFFPTVHLSYELPENNQFMLSYTRRINRPRGYFYEPFITWSDDYNVRQGNPALLPEFIGSYEISYQKEIGLHTFTTELYYKTTSQKIETIRIPYQENIILQTYQNVGKDYALGGEIIINLTLAKWYLLDLTGDFYSYKVIGKVNNVDFAKESFNWQTDVSNTIKIGNTTKIQISGNYTSPTAWSQGKKAGYYYINAAVKQTFFDKSLSLTFQAKDILGTAKDEIIYEGTGFYTYSLSKKKMPLLSLSLSWKFNKFKKETVFDAIDGSD